MICKVRHTIEKYGMIKDGDRVVVALSGGADSMCLLHILLSLKDEIGFTLSAAHVNHGIRGSEAERDQDFVNNYCDKNKIDLYICRLDVPSVSSQTGEGLEECGRRLRYDYLYNISDGALIATAHNLNDRIETFIFNFTRGSGLNGLCSIPPVRDKIIRPLIDCSREEIEDYCRTNSIPYVTDSTNSDVNYSRNRIRQNVIPELKAINQSFEKSALRCFDTVISDNEYISSVADSVYSKCFNNGGYSTALLINTHPSIRNRVISRIIYEKTGINPDKKTIDKTCELIKSEGKSEIQNGTVIRVNDGLLDFPDVFTFYEWKNDCKTGVNILPEAIVEVLSLNKNSTDADAAYLLGEKENET